MLLVLSEEHKEHLHFLNKVDAAVVGEFGRIALEFLRRGISPKVYEGAARKLSVPVEMVQHGVEGLMYLMTQSSKHMLSEADFVDSVLSLEFGDELNQNLLQMYQQHGSEIRSILSLLPRNLPAYHNLQWRLDVQLASRSLRQQTVPSFSILLQLTHGRGSDSDAKVLRVDPSTLLHLLSILEGALAALKSTHARRVLRNIK
ncbi:COMM domain-containing protein 2 isoform X2 [Corythoichthys intestinalis]|uniref:COMM domain-containing protein 2 isoform X2 n=1 Tax=Corythoichthys intestinalis TaxID=161448 RepID=UPI0025A55DE1|nr:COMM domain-containing protein 2 isoform X2 [Corythoichthys intestinalis]XP_061790838.1 COMM domain-containing protein 2 [Nerophis lumbriciformis]